MVHLRLKRSVAVFMAAMFAPCLIPVAHATDATGSMTVSTTIASSCSVSNVSNVTFGTITGQSISQTDATGSFDVTCTTGTSYSVNVDRGANVTGSTRRMKFGASSYLTYELYSDASRTSIWSAAITGLTGTNAAQSRTVYARLPAQTAPAPGTYTDTVTITVTY